MTPQRVNLITLGVTDLARARAFYAALGWEAAQEQEGISFYQMHGSVLALFGRESLAEDQGRPGTTLGTGAMTLAQNFLTTAEVDAAHAAALAAGASNLKTPEKVFWGGYSGYYADPDGHVWEVAMNPFSPVSADGSLTISTGIERIDETLLTSEDEAQIAELLLRCFDTSFGGRSFYKTRPHHRLLYREDGRIFGQVSVFHQVIRMGDRLVTISGLGDVATDPDRRGQGIAGRLVQRFIDDARDGAADFAVLFGDRPLYAGLGFANKTNPMRFVAMEDARTIEVRDDTDDGLMVMKTGEIDWDDAAPLDLLGPKF